jgi:hypothetical protein
MRAARFARHERCSDSLAGLVVGFDDEDTIMAKTQKKDDAIELLKQDHRKVEGFFKEL